jgi:hypothetical protein
MCGNKATAGRLALEGRGTERVEAWHARVVLQLLLLLLLLFEGCEGVVGAVPHL